MLILSMSVSVDGFIADREGRFAWSIPTDEVLRAHLAQVRELGGFPQRPQAPRDDAAPGEGSPHARERARRRVRRRLERDPEGVSSRTLDRVQGNARLAVAPLGEEMAAALDATGEDVAIGGAGLAAQAFELGLVDELRILRHPVVVGGGTPFLPPVAGDVPLDLVESTTFGSRVVYERFRRVREWD